MPKRMLIDLSHPEETRVVVLDGQKVEEFDFEAASKRPLKGNIYLAKVTRVEPSLQAAFVEYGGNRQGFLAFSEIHPDYYQIPVADRMALLAEQEAEARRRMDDEFESFDTATAPAQSSGINEFEEPASDNHDAGAPFDGGESELLEHDEEHDASSGEPDAFAHSPAPEMSDSAAREEAATTETTAAGDAFAAPQSQPEYEATADNGTSETATRLPAAQRPHQRWVRRRHYKIQEVIKRRQVILVQVVKEERGNKGAALTTYLSLAGRYCVLMPNTPRGGGISRKITNANDRKRLKSAAQALELPEGMGLIIRTAGENRTKAEIKRDYEYLLRMWDTIREFTLKSNAPACVYEEGDLIKRAIRDLYNKDVSEIVVEGDDGYRNAKDFMRMLMPSHAKNVKQYKEPVPLFQRLNIEAQLDAMFSPVVTLRSGGYVVINQTEALVAVDVNSGRATREHSIEDTAYKTNLEAAEEVARQLRLRDLAGLIVIDFIDMEDARNDRNVEKRLRDCVKNDRARVQIGKISQFGLLEMSRQRLRAGVVAGSTIPCPTCNGQGIVRSVELTALRVLRALDEEGQRQRANALVVETQVEVAMYTLNQKRREIARIEQDYGITVSFLPKSDVQAGTFELQRLGQRSPDERSKPLAEAIVVIAEEPEPHEQHEPESEPEEPVEQNAASPEAPANGEAGGRRRRRRRRRGRDRGPQQQQEVAQTDHAHVDTSDEDGEDEPEGDETSAPVQESFESGSGTAPSNEVGGRRRRRRRRRGRRGREGQGPGDGATFQSDNREHGVPHIAPEAVLSPPAEIGAPNSPSEPQWSFQAEDARVALAPNYAAPVHEDAPASEPVARSEVSSFAREERGSEKSVEPPAPPSPEQQPSEDAVADTPAGPTRKGWWQRPFRLRE